MSRFFSGKLSGLSPYVPGEQPRERKFIKLNTNESPFPPSPAVHAALNDAEIDRLRLYSDPDCAALVRAIAETLSVQPDQVIVSNGSDEILSFAFLAFGEHGVSFADITYGFYPVFAALYGLKTKIIPLQKDFSVNTGEYMDNTSTVVLANPNAPTGLCLPAGEIEKLLRANPDHPVIVDEAYVDFGGETALPLLKKYDNLLIVRTFSKSRSLAGGRVGFAVGSAGLIADLNRIRFSFNPYNVNRLSLLAAEAAVRDTAYFEKCRQEIIRVRENTKQALLNRGFLCTDSKANFLFVSHPAVPGAELAAALREKGILVRRFDVPRIENYLRITVGSCREMEALLAALDEILNTVPENGR